MRICILHNSSPGGALRLVNELATRFARTDDVAICTWGLKPPDPPTGVERLWVGGRRIALPPPFHPFGDLARSFVWSWRAAGAVDEAGFDVALVLACQWAQAPQALGRLQTPHLYFAQEVRRRSHEQGYLPALGRSGWRRPIWWTGRQAYDLVGGYLDNRAVAAAEHVVTNSSFTAACIDRAYSRQADVVPLGVDAGLFRPAIGGAGRRTALLVGALDPTKGAELAVRALARVPDRFRPPLHLVANRGDQSFGRHLVGLGGDLGVQVQVFWKISEPELVEQYQTALLVFALARDEPFGLTVLEATAAAAPVVALDSGGYRDTVRQGINGVLTGEAIDDIATAARRILESETAFDPVAMFAWADEWTWDRCAELLRSLLGAIRDRPAVGGSNDG